ncbi:MAG: glycoside hydrolase family 9 protein, partial [Planctomycetota bacterium]
GIALPPRIAGYDRPRPMHPDDGVKVFQGDATIFNGESGTMAKSLMRLTDGGTDATGLVEVEGAWGGYMDAGDWDRRSQHLHPTQLLIESYRSNPEFFETLALNVPDEELDNGVPDLIDEILWNVEFFQRLQRDDGGVRGGIESTAHPQNGETSWQESLMLGAFRAEPITSHRFAAAAAATADVLRPFDEARADALLADAIRAFDWATDDTDAKLREITSLPGNRKPTLDKLRESYRTAKELAAVELYRATGEQRFHVAFREKSRFSGNNLNATFAYATLPDDLADADLKQAAIAAVVAEADKTLAFGRGNTVGISHRVPTMPMMGFVGYFTTPESVIGPTLTRAHHLTGDDRYLAAAIRATSYGIGINPTGMTMTTGLGHAWPVEPLHIDSMRLAAPPPPGITVYGTHDPARAPNYIKRWTLPNTIPAWQDWPIAECYFDVGNWVEMNEYTVHQTIGPTANYFAHLASRDQTQPSQ